MSFQPLPPDLQKSYDRLNGPFEGCTRFQPHQCSYDLRIEARQHQAKDVVVADQDKSGTYYPRWKWKGLFQPQPSRKRRPEDTKEVSPKRWRASTRLHESICKPHLPGLHEALSHNPQHSTDKEERIITSTNDRAVVECGRRNQAPYERCMGKEDNTRNTLVDADIIASEIFLSDCGESDIDCPSITKITSNPHREAYNQAGAFSFHKEPYQMKGSNGYLFSKPSSDRNPELFFKHQSESARSSTILDIDTTIPPNAKIERLNSERVEKLPRFISQRYPKSTRSPLVQTSKTQEENPGRSQRERCGKDEKGIISQNSSKGDAKAHQSHDGSSVGIKVPQPKNDKLFITTKLAHPITFRVSQAECNWCLDIWYGLIGLPEKKVEVIDRGDARGYIEAGVGHVSEGYLPSGMCDRCTTDRTKILGCSKHKMTCLHTKDFSHSHRYSDEWLAPGRANNAPFHWCLICPSAASYACNTVDGIGCEGGCGLLLCGGCRRALVEDHGGNLRAFIDQVKEENPDEGYGLRADADLLHPNGELMRMWEGLHPPEPRKLPNWRNKRWS